MTKQHELIDKLKQGLSIPCLYDTQYSCNAEPEWPFGFVSECSLDDFEEGTPEETEQQLQLFITGKHDFYKPLTDDEGETLHKEWQRLYDLTVEIIDFNGLDENDTADELWFMYSEGESVSSIFKHMEKLGLKIRG